MEKRNFVGTVLTVFLLLALLLSCGGKKADDGTIVINVLSSDDYAGFRASIIPEFEAANPGIKVNFSSVGYDALHQKTVTAMTSGTSVYDVIDMDDIWTSEFVNAGYVDCIDDWVSDDIKRSIAPAALNINMYEGKLYGLPAANDLLFCYYNKEMLQKVGVSEFPATWDELTSVVQEIQRRGIAEYGTFWGWAQAEGLICYYYCFVKGFGGALADEKTHQPTVNRPENIRALQYMIDSLYETKISAPGSITSDDRNVIELFSQGKTLFALNWSFAWGVFNDPTQSMVVDKVGVALIPGTSTTRSASCAGTIGLAVASTSKNKEAAWKWIQFQCERGIQKRMALEAGTLPIWSEQYNDPQLIAQHPALPDMLAQLNHAYTRPSLVWYNEFSSNLQVELQNALTRNKTASQALNDAQKTLEALAKNY